MARRNPHPAASTRPTAPAERLPAEPLWVIAAVVAGIALYWFLFYAHSAVRTGSLSLLLLPDEVARLSYDGDPALIRVGERLIVLFWVGAILATAWAAGSLMLRTIRIAAELTVLERCVFAIGAGLNVISLWMLAVGLCGLLQSRLSVLLPAAIVWSLAIWSIYRERKRPGQAAESPVTVDQRSAEPRPAELLSRRWLWTTAPFITLIVLGGMLPPWDFDVREYHLQVPKEWYQQGSVSFLPHNIYGNMPLGAEMHALAAMVATGDWWQGALIGKTVIACFAPLTAAALFACGRRFWNRTAGVVAAISYVTVPWVAHVSMSGLIDGAVGCYLLLALYALLLHQRSMQAVDDEEWRRSRSWDLHRLRHLILAGFLAGAAAACKYPAVLFVVVPLTLFAAFPTLRLLHWRAATVFLLAVVAGCGLWYGKNWGIAGNPTYPLLYGVFGGETRTPEKNAQWTDHAEVPRDAEGRQFSLSQLIESAARIGWQSDFHGPLIVPLALLALLRRRWRRPLGILLIFCLFFIASWWLVTHRIDRFLVPLLPAAALLAGAGALWTVNVYWSKALKVILAFGLVGSFLLTVSPMLGVADMRILVSLDYLRHDPPDPMTGLSRLHPAHRILNDVVPSGARVLLVGDARPFELDMDALYSTCFDDCLFEQLMAGRTTQQRRAILRRLNISHVYFDWQEIDRYRATYGFSDYVTRRRVHDEFVGPRSVLQPLNVPLDPAIGEIFAVSDSTSAG